MPHQSKVKPHAAICRIEWRNFRSASRDDKKFRRELPFLVCRVWVSAIWQMTQVYSNVSNAFETF